MAQRILLAEDDARLATLVKEYLEAVGSYEVLVEGNGSQVARQLRKWCPDLLVLDVGLPQRDGFAICRDVRETFKGPILMLTARNDSADQILGLECGADDYVVKPAEPRVLLARIRALMRRCLEDAAGDEQLRFGGLVLRSASRGACLDGQEVALSSHEFDLLMALARHAGQPLSREYLFNTVYTRPYDGMDRSIDVRVSQLRKKLGDSAEQPFRIKTVWGRGYLFVPDAW